MKYHLRKTKTQGFESYPENLVRTIVGPEAWTKILHRIQHIKEMGYETTVIYYTMDTQAMSGKSVEV